MALAEQQPGKTITMKAQTPPPPRAQRARVASGHEAAPTRKPTIKRGSKPYLYHVESQTRPGIFHVIDVHRLTCTCEAGRYQRGCWHLRISRAYHDWRKRQHAQHSAASSAMAALQEAAA